MYEQLCSVVSVIRTSKIQGSKYFAVHGFGSRNSVLIKFHRIQRIIILLLGFCSRLLSTGHLASSVSFYSFLWLWFTMLPAQYAILHPIPTGLWKGWWETPCSILLALYHQLLHCCPGIVSSLLSFPICIWFGWLEEMLPFPRFLLAIIATSFFFSS